MGGILLPLARSAVRWEEFYSETQILPHGSPRVPGLRCKELMPSVVLHTAAPSDIDLMLGVSVYWRFQS